MKALEKIAALLKAEGINILDRDAVIASLSQTCAPSYNIRSLASWVIACSVIPTAWVINL